MLAAMPINSPSVLVYHNFVHLVNTQNYRNSTDPKRKMVYNISLQQYVTTPFLYKNKNAFASKFTLLMYFITKSST